jgi:hypothetical protein
MAETDFNPAAIEQPAPPPTAGPDPFDLESLRLRQDYAAGRGVKKALLTVPARKPDKTWFFRVHSAEDYYFETRVLELKEERETYLVAAALWPELETEPTFSPRALFTAVNRQGVLFLWPIRLPGPDGKLDDWNKSALEAAELAKKNWVRVTANMSLGAYDVMVATGQHPEPQWPEQPFAELLRLAFKDRFITGPDHPVLKKLRGEA